MNNILNAYDTVFNLDGQTMSTACVTSVSQGSSFLKTFDSHTNSRVANKTLEDSLKIPLKDLNIPS